VLKRAIFTNLVGVLKTEGFSLSSNPLKNYKKFNQTLLKRGRKTRTFPLLILKVEVFGF
jgi:hypothetical protein